MRRRERGGKGRRRGEKKRREEGEEVEEGGKGGKGEEKINPDNDRQRAMYGFFQIWKSAGFRIWVSRWVSIYIHIF
jgi:hypothetical protein